MERSDSLEDYVYDLRRALFALHHLAGTKSRYLEFDFKMSYLVQA